MKKPPFEPAVEVAAGIAVAIFDAGKISCLRELPHVFHLAYESSDR